jgi:transcriptional regulator with XRE-family HTH domain
VNLLLKKARLKKGITQAELVRLSGLSQSYISALENNTSNKSPSIKTIRTLADALDVCPLKLLQCNCKRKDRK